MEIIKAENLSFSYPDCAKAALSDISFSVSAGDFVTVCGRSGCGKSTLLRQIKPALAPNGEKAGQILFNGTDVCSLSHREQSAQIGFVMQNPDNQIVTDKVWHELAFGLESLGMHNNEIRGLVAEVASFFGIQTWFHQSTSTLSGGQKQLLNLASVMVMNPSVLVLDEPTAQLDPIASTEFLEMLAKINRELGTTVILSEHRLEEAFTLSNKVIVMDNGRIIGDGSPKDVGQILCKTGNAMLRALPTPMRVYYAFEESDSSPITAKEGKNWLEKVCQGRDTHLDIKEDKKPIKSDSVLKLSDIHFRYQKEEPDVIKGLSLDIKKGEFYAIVGGNGSGKTTALSVMSSLLKPYRGKIKAQGKVTLLPQNPQVLFTRKTVMEDLLEMKDKNEGKIKDVISLCQLDSLLDMHPYDLSGGEQQKVALAKVLLTEPDILLLDEPTKGLDALFKERLAQIIHSLKNKGVTVIAVSHDTEFCAQYADRCGMFFDGNIVSEGLPREFFCGKSFYTTTANRMAKDIIHDAIIAEDIIYALGGKSPEINDAPPPSDNSQNNNHPKKQSQKPSKIPKSTILAMLMMLIAVPLTMYFGTVFLNDRKYYFISILIILETLIPFMMVFEKRKPKARELVLISVMCAIAVVGRTAFYMVPHFKPVIAIIIISGFALGSEAGFLIGVITALVSNFFFGQGPWTVWQMFALGVIGFLGGFLSLCRIIKKSVIGLGVFGFLASVVIYGGIMNPQSVIMNQPNPTIEMITAAYLTGLPLDIIHGISTIIFIWIIAIPMIEKIERIKIKHGLLI